jgi:uncharacterized phage-associated protein
MVARILQRSGGKTSYLRLVKLVYLADRESIVKRGIPIAGGSYFLMRKGPVIGEIMNFAKQRNAPNWRETISVRRGHEIALKTIPTFHLLSPRELQIVDEVVAQHAHQDVDELVQWCHDNCPEVENVTAGRREISIEQILSAERLSPDRIQTTVKDLESLEGLTSLFA